MTPIILGVRAGYEKFIQYSNYNQNTIQIILLKAISSPLILDEIHIVSTYVDSGFTKEDHRRRIPPNDPVRVAIIPAKTDRGTKVEPFHVESRDLCINTLPPLFNYS
jgi:hypothetical protein